MLTSNVDGHFQQAGFRGVLEVHGSIHHLQCLEPCSDEVWPASHIRIDVDETTMRATSSLPRCRHCGRMARPNILMFGDGGWIDARTSAQEHELADWLHEVALAQSRLVVLEIGAGRAIPTVRLRAERIAAGRRHRPGGSLIRINPIPEDAAVPPGIGIALAAGGLAALTEIDARLRL